VQQAVGQRRISSEKVAENSRFWRFLGSSARIFLMSRMKPMSSMRSASSSTRISTPRGRWCAGCDVVEQAARRGDEDVDRFAAAICGLMLTPPNITMEVSGRCLP
jgi:hypothetical protein